MPNYKFHLVFSALFLALLLEKGTAIRCFYCSTIGMKSCGDPFNPELWYGVTQECEESQVCIKQLKNEEHTTKMNEPRGMIRSCGHREHCDREYHISDICEWCTSEFCNSAALTAPSSLLICLLFWRYFM